MNPSIPTADQITHAIGALTLLRVWCANLKLDGVPDRYGVHGQAVTSLENADALLVELREMVQEYSL